MTPPKESGAEADGDGTFAQAKRAALRFLAYRTRSQAEVRRRLQKRYPPEVIERVLTDLRDQRYLDDAAFARQWRQHREQNRPRGPGLLRMELLRLGVEAEVVREALAGFDATENAYRAGRTLARRLAGGEYSNFRRRLWSYLRGRGFDDAVISDVVNRLWRELTDPLDGGVDTDPEE